MRGARRHAEEQAMSNDEVISVRMIKMPQETKDAIASQIELGREWANGHDEGYLNGLRHGVTSLLAVELVGLLCALVIWMVLR